MSIEPSTVESVPWWRNILALYLGRWEGDQLFYAGKAQTGFQQRKLYELRERLDPLHPQDLAADDFHQKAESELGRAAMLAEIEYSAFTAERRLRAPIFKGIRDDLMAPRCEPEPEPDPVPDLAHGLSHSGRGNADLVVAQCDATSRGTELVTVGRTRSTT